MYIAMGWLALVGIVPMMQALPWSALTWLLVGGLFYSFGALIYALKRPDPWPKVFGYHEIWHLFVLAGSASHFVMMLRYVLPA
jgi:hemolysin III